MRDAARRPMGMVQTLVAARRGAWSHVIALFAFPPHIRRATFATNAIESVDSRQIKTSNQIHKP